MKNAIVISFEICRQQYYNHDFPFHETNSPYFLNYQHDKNKITYYFSLENVTAIDCGTIFGIWVEKKSKRKKETPSELPLKWNWSVNSNLIPFNAVISYFPMLRV